MRWLAVAVASAIACSSNAPSAPTAFAMVLAQVGPGDQPGGNDPSRCALDPQAWVEIAPSVTRTGTSLHADGDALSAGTLHVACRIAPNDDGTFVIDATAAVADTSLHLAGRASRDEGVTSDVQATFRRGEIAFASAAKCTIDYSARDGMDIQPGRLWALVTCARATDAQGRTCLASAEVVFQSCMSE